MRPLKTLTRARLPCVSRTNSAYEEVLTNGHFAFVELGLDMQLLLEIYQKSIFKRLTDYARPTIHDFNFLTFVEIT